MNEIDHRKSHPFTLMTAYQFIFYTFYQAFESVSLDRASAWKAGVVIGVLDAWMILIALEIFNVTDAAFSHSMWFIYTGAGILFALNYYVFNYHDRWKHYAMRFAQYSRNELIVGRTLVGALIIVSFICLMLSAIHHRRMQGMP